MLSWSLLFDPRQTLPANTALLHALNRHEHLSAPLADILSQTTTLHNSHTTFVSDFIRDIARLPSEHLAKDTSAAKSIAAFVSEMSERLPEICRANLALLLSQLDGDSYIVRNGIIHLIATLIETRPDPKDPLLDVLLERAHRDIHAFTRSKAIQAWITIASAKKVPIPLYPSLAEMATSRLEDKAVAVRKYAAQLLVALLQNNPFGPCLKRSHFEAKWKEVSPDVDVGKAGVVQDAEGQDRTTAGDIADENQSEKVDEELEDNLSTDGVSPSKQIQNTPGTDIDASSDTADQENDIGEVGEEVESNAETQADEDEEEDSELVLKRKYYSSSLAFTDAVERGLKSLYDMLRSKSVTDVSESVSFLITAVQFQLEAASGVAVRKMLPLILAREANVRQIAVKAYAKLLCPGGLELAGEKDAALAIAKSLIALGLGATTGELACLESLISAMFQDGGANVISPAVIAVIWDLFEGRIPGATEKQRRTACILVGMVAAERPQTLQKKIDVLESIGICDPAYSRWSCAALCKLESGTDIDGRLSQQLCHVAKTSNSMSAVEQALNAIFQCSPEPEQVVGSLIRDLAAQLHSNAASIDIIELSRFLVVVGHVAVKELVRIEVLISKVRKDIAEQAKSDGNHDEEEQANAEADRALEVAEKELVNPSSLLGRYGTIARKIASDNTAEPILQASAVLCLAKLMCVQERFCESNLRLLFSVLSGAIDPQVRSNAVTALGDLAFRFPNLVEPWSSHIYSSLRDSDEKVRKNTLMTLTHLILNDMIKVKGQIVGLAVCILDENKRIAELAKLFFNELARKAANAIYNILPDTISCMSKMDDLTKSGFKTVVSFLVGLMDKEKHGDGMVEKLCHRFRTSESDREAQELAYCISILNISERGLKKLNENFKSYSCKLSNDDVYEYISAAVSKCNKQGISASWAQAIEELQQKIERTRAPEKEAENSQHLPKKRGSSRRSSTNDAPKPSRRPRAPKKKVVAYSESEGDSDSVEDSEDSDESDATSLSDDDDTSDEQDSMEVAHDKRYRARGGSGKPARTIRFSEDVDEE
ncbi:Condensin complex subunit 1 [Gracilaria domingensis]|nr:Condensin complex subunit 1 [Gracilaria domingensis]